MPKSLKGPAVKFVLGAVIIAAAWLAVSCRCVPFQALTPAALRDAIRSLGRLAPLAYIGAYALNTVSLLPPIALLSLIAGLAFGFARGAAYLMAGALIGTSAAFMISRYFARGLIKSLIIRGKLKDFDQKLARNGFLTVLFLRIIPLIPYEVLNYGAGLSGVKFKDYFLATFLGLMPGVIISAFFGARLGEIKSVKDLLVPEFMIALGLMICVIAVPVIYKIRAARKADSKTRREEGRK